MTHLRYTKTACLQMIDTLKHLKHDNAQRLNELQEQQINADRALGLVKRLEGLIDLCEEIVYDRLKEIEEERT